MTTTTDAALAAYTVHIEGEGEIATVTASTSSQALDLAAEEIAQGDWLDDGETATTVAYWIIDAQGTRTDGSVTITDDTEEEAPTEQTWTPDDRLLDLCDSETSETIGQASTEQIEASLAAGPEGHILIDTADGEVVPESREADYSGPMGRTLRAVYVEADDAEEEKVETIPATDLTWLFSTPSDTAQLELDEVERHARDARYRIAQRLITTVGAVQPLTVAQMRAVNDWAQLGDTSATKEE